MGVEAKGKWMREGDCGERDQGIGDCGAMDAGIGVRDGDCG